MCAATDEQDMTHDIICKCIQILLGFQSYKNETNDDDCNQTDENGRNKRAVGKSTQCSVSSDLDNLFDDASSICLVI